MNSIFIRLEAYQSYFAIMQIVYNYCEYTGHPTNISLLVCPSYPVRRLHLIEP
jgi:hypothetical protein